MKDLEKNNSRPQPEINRRQFIRGVAAVVGAGFLTACGARDVPSEGTPFRTAMPGRVLASPQASPNPTVTGVPEGSISLDEFLALSALLTGVDNLDPVLGQVYLQALEAGTQPGSSLANVYSAASSGSNLPQDLEPLQQGGFFDQEGVGSLADAIIEMWYTGMYTLDGEDRVATYVDALAWKVLTFTKPPTICGRFGFWAENPRVQISPVVQYTPVPTPAEGQ